MRPEQEDYVRRVLQRDWFSTGHRLAKEFKTGKITEAEANQQTKMARNALLAASDKMGFRLWPPKE